VDSCAQSRRDRALFDHCLVPEEMQRRSASDTAVWATALLSRSRSSATAEIWRAPVLPPAGDNLERDRRRAAAQAVLGCFSSLFTSQAMFYRRQQGDDAQVSMALVVQRMINSEKSGVTFTVDPVLHNRYNMIIEGVWGLGEGIVSGKITPDHYKIDRETYEILDEFVPEKPIMVRRCEGADGGIQTVAVPPATVPGCSPTKSCIRWST
jgi:phosphoenolpyruvate synthase/pyruvate phosphate dikinase